MSNVPIKDADDVTRKIDVFTRTEGPDTLESQAVVVIDPTNGNALKPNADGSFTLSPAQVAALTPPAAITGFATETTSTTIATASGAPADAEATGNGSIIAVLKRIRTLLNGTLSIGGAVSVSNFPATQPISAASLPLATNAAQETGGALAAINTDLGAPTDAAAAADGTGDYAIIPGIKRALLNWATLLARIPEQGQATMAASLPVVLASNQSNLPIVENALILTGAAAQTAVVNNILESASGTNPTTVDNYRAISVQVTSTGTGGTFIFEQSNDNANFVPLPVFNSALVTGVPIAAAITATASSIIYTIPLRCRYIRLRIATTITGGSIRTFSRVSTEPWTATVALVASNTAANLNATVSGTVTANQGTMAALPAGTNAVGDIGIQYRASATGAATPAKVIAAATTNATNIKASAGRVLGWQLQNTTASIVYVKFHNQNVAPTAGASVLFPVAIPANGKSEITLEGGTAFATGIGYTIVTGSADADATAVTAGAVVGSIKFI